MSPSGSLMVIAGIEEGGGGTAEAAAAEQNGRSLWLAREVGRRMGVRAAGREERREWLGTLRGRPAGVRMKAWVLVRTVVASSTRETTVGTPLTAVGMIKPRFIRLCFTRL